MATTTRQARADARAAAASAVHVEAFHSVLAEIEERLPAHTPELDRATDLRLVAASMVFGAQVLAVEAVQAADVAATTARWE